jgi:uncharacterized protein YutE (UPF0331/DUF86 family)
MYDFEKITKIIKDIEKFFSEIDSFGFNNDSMSDQKTFYASSMAIFGILNRNIDLAEEIIIKNEFGMPNRYEEYFDILAKNSMIDNKLSTELKKLVKARNLFAHEYFDIERKDVLKTYKNLIYVKDFIKKVKEIIKKQ